MKPFLIGNQKPFLAATRTILLLPQYHLWKAIWVLHCFLMVNSNTSLYYYIFFAGLSVLATLLLMSAIFVFLRDPECCRSKQASHPSPYQYYYYILPDYESGIRKSLSIYLPYIHVRISWPVQISILCFICNLYCITTRILSNPPSSPT